MKNNKPFEILLDMNANESFQLFCVVRSLFDYPAIYEDDQNVDIEGKLFASAFSLICSHYLVEYAGMYAHEDFGLFVEEMKFDEGKSELVEYAKKYDIEYSDDFDDFIYDLIKKTRIKIVNDIKTLFYSEDLQLRLFSSIFEIEEYKAYSPSSWNGFTTTFLL